MCVAERCVWRVAQQMRRRQRRRWKLRKDYTFGLNLMAPFMGLTTLERALTDWNAYITPNCRWWIFLFNKTLFVAVFLLCTLPPLQITIKILSSPPDVWKSQPENGLSGNTFYDCEENDDARCALIYPFRFSTPSQWHSRRTDKVKFCILANCSSCIIIIAPAFCIFW